MNARRTALLPLREKVACAAGPMRGPAGLSHLQRPRRTASGAQPLIRQPAADTFSRKGRRGEFA
jgi:hypothetical protein